MRQGLRVSESSNVTEFPHKPKRLGRPQQWAERTPVRFAEGTFGRITMVLRDDEDRSDFIRLAVNREVERREAEAIGQQP